MRQTKYTKGVAGPENGVENWGLKKVETPGPIIAADMMIAPSSLTESFFKPACKGTLASIFSIFIPKIFDFHRLIILLITSLVPPNERPCYPAATRRSLP